MMNGQAIAVAPMEVTLLPETDTLEDGMGLEVALGPWKGQPLVLTLGISRIAEQQSLDISIWGSSDDTHWRQLTTFPQKYYSGVYLLLLDLAQHQGVHQVRAQWRMSRWGDDERYAQTSFYLTAETARVRRAGAA
jgi:hypothetical protein